MKYFQTLQYVVLLLLFSTVVHSQYLTPYGEISTSSSYNINKYGQIGTTDGLTVNGSSLLVPNAAPNGLSQDQAAPSAYAIKQNYPASTDGLYWISNPNVYNGTPFQVYADMTTDGGGWILLNSSGGGGASTESSTVTSLDQRNYLSRSVISELSQDATTVMLASGPNSSKTYNKTISTDSRPISALMSLNTSHQGPGTFHYNSAYTSFVTYSGSTWSWSYSCQPSSVTGWPVLYHACGNASGVHFIFSSSSSSGMNWQSGYWYSTWIR